MRPRRPSTPYVDDLPPDEPVFESVDEAPIDPDEGPPPPSRSRRSGDERERGPREREPSPLEVCLACGATSLGGGDCSHDEVARLERPTPVIVAAIQRLHQTFLERRQHERALHKLVTAEVTEGRGEVRVTPPPAPRPAPPAVAPQSLDATPPTRQGKRRAVNESQTFFSFAAPPPPPEPPSSEEPVAPLPEVEADPGARVGPEPPTPGGEPSVPREAPSPDEPGAKPKRVRQRAKKNAPSEG